MLAPSLVASPPLLSNVLMLWCLLSFKSCFLFDSASLVCGVLSVFIRFVSLAIFGCVLLVYMILCSFWCSAASAWRGLAAAVRPSRASAVARSRGAVGRWCTVDSQGPRPAEDAWLVDMAEHEMHFST